MCTWGHRETHRTWAQTDTDKDTQRQRTHLAMTVSMPVISIAAREEFDTPGGRPCGVVVLYSRLIWMGSDETLLKCTTRLIGSFFMYGSRLRGPTPAWAEHGIQANMSTLGSRLRGPTPAWAEHGAQASMSTLGSCT